MASYAYTVGVNFTSLIGTIVDLSALQTTIFGSLSTVQYLSRIGSVITVFFSGSLTGPQQTTLTGIINAYTYIDVTETITTDISVATISNKKLRTDTNYFVDPADITKQLGFSVSGSGTGRTLTLLSAITGSDKTITFPNVTDTVTLLTAAQTLTNKTLTNGVFNGTGSTTATSSSIYSNPSSTAITGASSYFFNYFNSPTTVPTTFTGIASTVFIAGAPTSTTGGTGLALNIAAGKTYLGGALQFITGASNGFVLTSDASGNASWASASSIASFIDGTASSPGIYFAAEAGTGFFRPGTGQIGVGLSGANYVTFSTTNTTFVNRITVSATTNQFVLGTTNTVTLTAPAPAASRVYTIPDAGGVATFIMSTFGSAQTIAGGLISSGALTASNGFTLATGALNLTSTSGALSLTGTTFSTNTQLLITATTNQFILGTTNTITVTAPAPAASRVYTIPDAGGAASLVLTAGAQTLSGATTFSGTTVATSSTTGNVINLGGTGISRNMWLGTSFSNTVNGLNGALFNIPSLTFTDSSTAASGTAATNNIWSIIQPTISATNATVTTTNASTAYIGGAPIKGTNETFTNAYGLYIDSAATTAATVTEASALYIANAPTVIGGISYAVKVNAGKTFLGGVLQIPTGAANGFILSSDAVGNASWVSALQNAIYVEVILNSSLALTNTTVLNISGLTITPTVAGVYKVIFNTNVRVSNGNRIVTFDLAKNGTSITNTQAVLQIASSSSDTPFSIQCTVSVNGTSDVLTARAFVSSNTYTMQNYRYFYAQRLTT